MFGWFKATCPVEPAQRVWLQGRMRWLAGEFGLERARQGRLILPTPEFFPEAYDATPAAGRVLFDRVARYMGINPGPIELVWYEDQPLPVDGWQQSQGAAGLYEGGSLGT